MRTIVACFKDIARVPLFNIALAQDLSSVNVGSTILAYVNDLLICSTTEQCVKDTKLY